MAILVPVVIVVAGVQGVDHRIDQVVPVIVEVGPRDMASNSVFVCRRDEGTGPLQHGNAAEHMSLPLAPEQMSSRGSRELGVTEMKGSWFIFDRYRAHEDWCRWRAPYWHGSRVMDPASHHNYHLGFRCCKTIRREPTGGDGIGRLRQ